MGLEVLKQTSAAADHLQEPLAGIKIFLVSLQVRGELRDALREERNLNLGGAGIGVVQAELLNDRSGHYGGTHGGD